MSKRNITKRGMLLRIFDVFPVKVKPFLLFLYSRLKLVFKNKKTLNEIHSFWKNPDDENLPNNYALGEKNSEYLIDLFSNYVSKDSNILEIGCNVGTHLKNLYGSGYKNLSGIEINENAVRLMQDLFPESKDIVRIYNSPVEDAILSFDENSFDVIYSVAVLEHIHTSSEFIFKEMARVSSKYIITIEDEFGVSWRHFPRNYNKIFVPLGFKEIFQTRDNLEGVFPVGFWVRVFEKNSN